MIGLKLGLKGNNSWVLYSMFPNLDLMSPVTVRSTVVNYGMTNGKWWGRGFTPSSMSINGVY